MALDYLNQYGNSFQLKIIANLLKPVNKTGENNEFLAQIFDILTPDFFESDANQWIISKIIDYYKKYLKPPTIDFFKAELASIDEITQEAVKENVKEAYKYILNATDLDYVKDEFLEFCQNQNMKQAILESVDLLKSKDYQSIKNLVDNALKFGNSKRDLGHVYEEMIEDRIVKNPRTKVIGTEWAIINEIMDGGAGAGDLIILIGAAGSGKSWALSSVGLHALTLGKNVLHFSLELNENYTGMRYDSRLIGIPSQNLKYHMDDLKVKILSDIKGKLRIKYYPTKSVGVSAIKTHVNRLMSFGFEPDLIIVDYADILRSDSVQATKGGSYFEAGGIYEDLRGMAGEFQVPVWTASQAQRGAANEEIITGDQVAESYKKIMTGDVVISIARKIEDKLANTARWHVIKNRYGIDGITFPSKVDSSIGRIEIFAPDSVSGYATRKEMKNSNELVKKELALKYKDFQKESGNEPIIEGSFE